MIMNKKVAVFFLLGFLLSSIYGISYGWYLYASQLAIVGTY